ncbi:TetR/AcrR family transcriptional regulator [Phenylobacterium sp. LjRoot225]|uniref:TetR/AcrR family transcriptional regulator n=1 Tax=Phenylobacterium sp. LjRoot225 TaxID=3342285 RepID=UPI003ECEDAE2
MDSQIEPLSAPDVAQESPSRSGRGPGRPTLSNEALLDKALDIFLEKGFEGTSIDAITAAAGVAKRTVYLRYGDKTTLFRAALERAIEEWIVPVETLQAAESDDLEETLLRIGQILVANIMTRAGLRLLRITNAESVRMPEIGAYAYRHGTGRTLVYLADLFRRRVKPGGRELADADEAALAFLNLVVGGPPSMALSGVELDQAEIDRHTRSAVSLFLHGLLPREASGEERETALAGPCGAEAQDLRTLEAENRRLRTLLVEAMLEAAALKEGRSSD